MADIPTREPLDELPNKNVTANSYEPTERDAPSSPRKVTTSSTDPMEEETTSPTSNDSVEDITSGTTDESPSTDSSGPRNVVLFPNQTTDDYGYRDPLPSLSDVLFAETQEKAVELMVKRAEAFQSLSLEAAEMALGQKAFGKTLGEIEFSITEITRGLNKSFAHEMTLFPYIIAAINLRAIREAVDKAEMVDKRGMN